MKNLLWISLRILGGFSCADAAPLEIITSL